MKHGCSNWGSSPKETANQGAVQRTFLQFLGTKPGIVVELLDNSVSPYRVRTAAGFEFLVGADEFNTYYKPVGEKTPTKWTPFVTNPTAGLVEAEKMRQVMEFILGFQGVIRDFDKARVFSRDLVQAVEEHPTGDTAVKGKMAELGWVEDLVDEGAVPKVRGLPEEIRELLKDDRCAVLHFLDICGSDQGASEAWDAAQAESQTDGPGAVKPKKSAPVVRKVKMKNVEMDVDGDILRLTIDCSKDLGPSKSGKTIMVASSEGTKAIPGRVERMGLNLYREAEGKRQAMGRRNEFKNVAMELTGDILTITVDLSQDLGPSKSGKTNLVASTGGNQLVLGRSEKLGLNVYRAKE